MIKFILNIIVFLGAWFGVEALGYGQPWKGLASVAAMLILHFAWERIVGPGDLRTLAVAEDDPIMLQAREDARASLPALRKLYLEHPNDTVVKFRFDTDEGEVEFLWGYVRTLEELTAEVEVVTPPVAHGGDFETHRRVRTAEIIDWQIERQDGTLLGGFTNRALFRIYERDHGELPRNLKEELSRYRELFGP